MNLRKDHYRIFVRINFRQKKAKMHSLVSSDRARLRFRSAVGKAASGTLVPGCPLLPAAAYNPRPRVSHVDAVGSTELDVRPEGTPVF